MGTYTAITSEQRRKQGTNSSAATCSPAPGAPDLNPTVELMLRLQRTVGNHAVNALIQRYQSQPASSPLPARAANSRAASGVLIQRCFGVVHPGCACAKETRQTADAGDTPSVTDVPSAGSTPSASAMPIERNIVGGLPSSSGTRERPSYGSFAGPFGLNIHLQSRADAPAIERSPSSCACSQARGKDDLDLSRSLFTTVVQRQDDDQDQVASGEVSDAGVPFDVSGAVSGAAAAAGGGSDAGTAPGDQSQTADNQGPTSTDSGQQPDTSQQGGTPSSNSGAGPTGSPAYQQGYQDGVNGNPPQPAPWDGQMADDYQEGYDKGHYEFTQQASSPSGVPSGPNASQGPAFTPAPAAAPDSEPNQTVALQQDQEAYQAGYQDGKSGASYNYLGLNLGIGYEADYQNGYNDGQQAGGNIPQAGSSAPSDQTSIGPETPDQQNALGQQKSLNESVQVCERRPPEFRDMCLRNLAGMPYSSWGGRAPKVYEPYE